MVKANPRIQIREARKRKRLEQSYAHSQTPFLCFNLTPPSPSSNHLHHLRRATNPDQTPPPSKKKRPFSCSSPSPSSSSPLSSPSYSSSTYGTCSSSSPPMSPPSPRFLRRTVSDPPLFCSDSKKMRMMYRSSPSPPLMGLLPPPLPPLPSPKLLRRTVSDPVRLMSSPAAVKSSTTKPTTEEAVKAERLSQQLVLIKFKCGCGSDSQFLLSDTENKCYKLVS